MKHSIIITQFIQSGVPKIWEALTDKQKMKEWYFDIPDFELKQASVFNFYEPGEEKKFHHQCCIKEIIPNIKLAYSWSYPKYTKAQSLVTWLLKEENNGTLVALTHDGVENFQHAGSAFDANNFKMGWEAIVKYALKNYINGIRKLLFKTEINAPLNTVWDKLWNKKNYEQWASAFQVGTTFTGELKTSERIQFLNSTGNGIYSNIIFFNEYNAAVFQHIGEVKNYVELPINADVEKWSGSYETYKLKVENGVTHLTVELDTLPKYTDYFQQTFPKALAILKQICEEV